MDDPVGPLIIERVWTTTDQQPAYRIHWTAAQLRRIGQAVRDGDQAFLATIEQAMRRALEAALTPQAERTWHVRKPRGCRPRQGLRRG
jgi:hypothetical protein